MPTDFELHAETIEKCYEFTLSYAAQGHSSDRASAQGRQLREHLERAIAAMRGLGASCVTAFTVRQLAPAAPYEAFFAVLARDARDSVALMDLLLAQPVISSQLIDNLNASIHLRALLTDLFLVTEILEIQKAHATDEQHTAG